YAKVGEIQEWRWPASPGRPSLRLRGRMIPALDESRAGRCLATLWQQMADALGEFIIGERDCEWLAHRYQAHPTNVYQIWMVEHRLSGTPMGALVLRLHDTEVELMDVIAPPARLPTLIRWTQRFAGRSGRQSVRFWASSGISAFLDACGGTQHPLDLHIPCNTWSTGPAKEQISGRWWLTAGDTDF